jgi:hypothetical protein
MDERVIVINSIQSSVKISVYYMDNAWYCFCHSNIKSISPRNRLISSLYYIVESEKLKDTQWDIFHIFTAEDIDHVTVRQFAFEREISQFLVWHYTGCLKKNAMEIQQAVVLHKLN